MLKNRLIETVLLSNKIYAKTDGQENIYNFMLQNFVYLNLYGKVFNILEDLLYL